MFEIHPAPKGMWALYQVGVFENVPGLLSDDRGRSAAMVLREFARIGFHGGWRVLDSQYFGVAQRRDRVFGVFARGRAGARRAAEILALAQGGDRHPATVGEAQQAVAAALRSRSHSPGVSAPGRGGEDDQNLVVAAPITAGYHKGAGVNDGKKGSPQNLILQAHHPRNCPDDPLVIGHTLKSAHRGIDNAWQYSYPHTENSVRRLMPVEGLRLQAFPDDWLDVEPPLSDSAKYRLVGNVVPEIAEWIGRRIVEALES